MPVPGQGQPGWYAPPPPQQAALLRVVQEKEVVAVGDVRPRRVDVRFVAATHHDLDRLTQKERFRPDLLARLDTTPTRRGARSDTLMSLR